MSGNELYWTKLAAIGQIAGAVATFLAVLVALYYNRRSMALRVRVVAQEMIITHPRENIQTVSITVENIGLRKVIVNGLYWTTGFRKLGIVPLPKTLALRSAFQIPAYDWVINQNFPWELEPGETKSTHFRRANFYDSFREAKENDLFRKFPFATRWRLVRLRVSVGISTQQRVNPGRVDKKIIQKLEANYERNG